MNYPMSIQDTARTFVQSKLFPDLKNDDQVATLLIIGRGFNISDYDSVTGLYLRQGKVNMHANVMAAAIKASGKYDYEVVANTDVKCEIEFYRVDHTGRFPIGHHSFTIEQANRANLTKNFTWQQYPEAMLFARCISAGYRAHCPDALGAAPVYVEQHGEMEVEGAVVMKMPPPQRAVPEKPSTEVDDTPVPVRKALVQEIQDWTGNSREEAIGQLMGLLEALGLPTDGTCEDMALGQVLVWASGARARGADFGDLFDDEHFRSIQSTLNIKGDEDIDF
jgi:hypothetical protein